MRRRRRQFRNDFIFIFSSFFFFFVYHNNDQIVLFKFIIYSLVFKIVQFEICSTSEPNILHHSTTICISPLFKLYQRFVMLFLICKFLVKQCLTFWMNWEEDIAVLCFALNWNIQNGLIHLIILIRFDQSKN